MTSVGGNDAALSPKSKIKEPKNIQVREKGAAVTTNELVTATRESKKGLEIHRQVPNNRRMANEHSATTQAHGGSKEPASSRSQSSKKTTGHDQDGPSTRMEALSEGERSVKRYETRSTGASPKGLASTKVSPGKAKGIGIGTNLSFQMNPEARAATSVARTLAKKGKEVERAENPEGIKKTKKKRMKKKKKQADPGASMVGQQLEAGKLSSKKKAAVHCKITIRASTSGCVRQ